MATRYKDTPSDRANFSDCVLKLLTLPGCVLQKLRNQRKRIRRDPGVRLVLLYTLCSRVLGRIGHVPCPKKQSEALRRLEEMLVGGITKKRKGLGRPGAAMATRDRALSYAERYVLEYLCTDLESAFGNIYECAELHDSICAGGVLLKDILDTMNESPSLTHILPVSILSLSCLFMELMIFGGIKSVEGVDSEGVQQFRRDDMNVALESISLQFLKPLHPCAGIVAGGVDRPLFSPSSVHCRDGEIAKIALSHTALASALCMGARMRKASLPGPDVDRVGDERLALETFFLFLTDAVMSKWNEGRECQSVMEIAEDFLATEQGSVLVLSKHVDSFFPTYEALQKCNRVSVQSFRGRGALLHSRDVPDVVRCRQVEKRKGLSPDVEVLLSGVDRDFKSFRRRKNSCLDSACDVVREDGSKSVCYLYPVAKDVCHLLFRC